MNVNTKTNKRWPVSLPNVLRHDADILEQLIDDYDLETIVEALSRIASDKSDHIASSYGDHALAQRWAKSSDRLGMCAMGIGEDLNI